MDRSLSLPVFSKRLWLGSLAAVLALAVLIFCVSHFLPDPRRLRDSAWVGRHFGLARWTPLGECSRPAVQAILLSEDDSFYRNHGLRLDEVGSAAWDDVRHMGYRRGASSLTQQVVKNAFLSKNKTLGRKVEEMVLARRAFASVDKRTLLEDYLNLVEWGPHHERGIAWAAQTYFACAPSALTARDGALLAWLLPDPAHRARLLLRGALPASAKRHVQNLLRRMRAEGGLSPADTEAMEQRPYPIETPLTATPKTAQQGVIP